MKDTITVCPIQLPGREERIMEKPYHNMTDMLDELEETIWENIRGPYAFWGHSMGGKIAYELEKEWKKRKDSPMLHGIRKSYPKYSRTQSNLSSSR